MTSFTPAVDLVWQIAASEVGHARQEVIEPQHLLIGMCKLTDFRRPDHLSRLGMDAAAVASTQIEIEALLQLFAGAGLNPTGTRRELRRSLGIGSHPTNIGERRAVHRSPLSRQIFARADALARENGAVATRLTDLLAALLELAQPTVGVWLHDRSIDVARLYESARSSGSGAIAIVQPAPKVAQEERFTPSTPRAQSSPPALPPALTRYGIDLVQLAREGKIARVVARDNEMLQVARALSRATRNFPLLIGKPGVGKTAVIDGLAWRIAH